MSINRLADAKKELVNSLVGRLEELIKQYKLGEIGCEEIADEIKKAGKWFI